MEHLGDDVDHEIKQVAAGNSPVQGLVLVQGVQRKIPGNIKFAREYFSLICLPGSRENYGDEVACRHSHQHGVGGRFHTRSERDCRVILGMNIR